MFKSANQPKWNFEKDLELGKRKERELADLLIKRGKVHQIKFNDDYRFDLRVYTSELKSYTIELKTDMTYERTGNIGVESACRGKPSGINTTEADYWVFALKEDFFLIPTPTLKRLINNDLFDSIARGGDPGSDTVMFLFKADFLLPKMTQLNEPLTSDTDELKWEDIGSGKSLSRNR